MRPPPLLLKLTLLWLLALGLKAAPQSAPSGLLIYKDNSFTADEFANATEFTSLDTFQTVYNGIAADGSKLSLLASLVQRRVDYDRVRPRAFPDILTEADLAPVEAAVQNLEAIAQKFPPARKYLAPLVAELKLEQERFRKGQGKLGGQWFATRALATEERDRPLRQAAAERAKAEAMAKSQVERAAEDARQRAAAMNAATAAETARAQEFNTQMEALLKRVVADPAWSEPITDLAKIKPLSKDLLREIDRADGRRKDLDHDLRLPDARRLFDKAVPQLDAASTWAHATQSFAALDAPEGMTTLREFVARYSAVTNPEIGAVWDHMLELHKLCREKDDEAQIHLRKAEQLAASGKNSQAIGEYQTAYALFPSSTIMRHVSKLRKDSLGL